MAKYSSLFSSDFELEKNIYVVDDFGLDIVGHGDVTCQQGHIINIFHVSYLSSNLLSVS